MPWISRRLIAVVMVAPAFMACATSQTPSKAEIAARPAQSMHDCNFRLTGTFSLLGESIPITGSGVFLVKPAPAARWQVNVSAGREPVDMIDFGKRLFTRRGTELWSDEPVASGLRAVFLGDPVIMAAAFSGSNQITYVGAEKIDGDAVWHIRTHDAIGTYDEWVRESDGVTSRLSFQDENKSDTATLTCVRWNSRNTVDAPAPKNRACATGAPGDITNLGMLSAHWPAPWVARSGATPGVEFTCGISADYSAILAIYPAGRTSPAKDALATLRNDAAGQKLTDTTSWSFATYQGGSFDLTVRSTFKFASTGFDCLRSDIAGCPAGRKLRIGAVNAGRSAYVVYFVSAADSFDAYFAAATVILDSVSFNP